MKNPPEIAPPALDRPAKSLWEKYLLDKTTLANNLPKDHPPARECRSATTPPAARNGAAR